LTSFHKKDGVCAVGNIFFKSAKNRHNRLTAG